jgi:hypothetical protein
MNEELSGITSSAERGAENPNELSREELEKATLELADKTIKPKELSVAFIYRVIAKCCGGKETTQYENIYARHKNKDHKDHNKDKEFRKYILTIKEVLEKRERSWEEKKTQKHLQAMTPAEEEEIAKELRIKDYKEGAEIQQLRDEIARATGNHPDFTGSNLDNIEEDSQDNNS